MIIRGMNRAVVILLCVLTFAAVVRAQTNSCALLIDVGTARGTYVGSQSPVHADGSVPAEQVVWNGVEATTSAAFQYADGTVTPVLTVMLSQSPAPETAVNWGTGVTRIGYDFTGDIFDTALMEDMAQATSRRRLGCRVRGLPVGSYRAYALARLATAPAESYRASFGLNLNDVTADSALIGDATGTTEWRAGANYAVGSVTTESADDWITVILEPIDTGRVVLQGLAIVPTQLTWYVSPASPAPAAPYATWETAAHTIQEAIDAAAPGSTVVVSNGVYDTGGAPVGGGVSNRVVVVGGITVKSVGGPAVTVIQGKWGGGDPTAVRGAYVSDGGALIGFTLRGGQANNMGDAYGGGAWIDAGGRLSQCVVTGNVAYARGGGVYCVADAMVERCVISGNVAEGDFGHAEGGGVYCDGGGTVRNCVIAHNQATCQGGGAYCAGGGRLRGCTVYGNRAQPVVEPGTGYVQGGGLFCTEGAIIENCIIAENVASTTGGVASGDNWFNESIGGAYTNCCTLPAVGTACVTSAPMFIDAPGGNFRLTPGSPCIDAGTVLEDANIDLDGEWRPRDGDGDGTAAFDIGAYEYVSPDEAFAIQIDLGTSAGAYDVGTESPAHAIGAFKPMWNRWNAAAGDVNTGLVLADGRPGDGVTLDVGISSTAASPINWGFNVPSAVGIATNGVYGTALMRDRVLAPSGRAVGVRVRGLPVRTYMVYALVREADHPERTYAVSVGANISAESASPAYVGQANGVAAWAAGLNYIGASVTTMDTNDWVTVIVRSLDSSESCLQGLQLVAVGPPTTRYVRRDSPATAPPYTGWETAAHTIQEALDAAMPGDLVLVTNGVYDAGLRILAVGAGARAALTVPLTLRSVNGPAHTVIRGQHAAGSNAVRCAYVCDGAAIDGFSLNEGGTLLEGNNERAQAGGGIYFATAGGTALNCVVTACEAWRGGGAFGGGRLERCTLHGNHATYEGGGACGSALRGCVVTGNTADYYGGGASGGFTESCTIVGNHAGMLGGGLIHATAVNSIVYYNTDASGNTNCVYSTMDHCCTTPNAGDTTTGNLLAEPRITSFADARLAEDSPCINAGANAAWMPAAVDVDGDARIRDGTVDIGADEFDANTLGGPLAVTIGVEHNVIQLGRPLCLTAGISGRARGFEWDFDDGTRSSGLLTVEHTYAGGGAYSVVCSAWNDAGTVAATQLVQVSGGACYVSPTGANVSPFADWSMAATDIQAAIDAAPFGGTVWVEAGVYATGGRAVAGGPTNRVCLDKAVTVRSVRGPASTYIVGAGPPGPAGVRCAYLADGAVLAGFTLTNGCTWLSGDTMTMRSGGGVFAASTSATVSNCVISGCQAWRGAGSSQATLLNCVLRGNVARTDGGGAFGGRLYSCLIAGNQALSSGGGARYASLFNCTVVGNKASGSGGGVIGAHVENSIVYYNTAGGPGADIERGTGVRRTCTPTDWPGGDNVTAEPEFVDRSGDFHLLPGSPCLNRGGVPAWNLSANDLDGNPRVIDGACELGAYEFRAGPLVCNLLADVRGGDVPLQVVFTAAVAGTDLGGLYYVWDFDGDGESDLEGYGLSTVTNVYERYGKVDVSLSVSNAVGELAGRLKHEYLAVSPRAVYVSPGGLGQYPYTNWQTAASSLQDAVDAVGEGGTVWVTNGVYAIGAATAGGELPCRVVLSKPVTVRSVNGPAVTTIVGAGPIGPGAVRCAYVGDGAVLAGFTLSNGCTRTSASLVDDYRGGGALCRSTAAVISNCLFTACAARYGGGVEGGVVWNSVLRGNAAAIDGGAAENATLRNCLMIENSAGVRGGGARGGNVQNCTVVANHAGTAGGGVAYAVVLNSIVYDNTAGSNTNWLSGSIAYSCTTPIPNNDGNIAEAPAFVDAGAGDYRLAADSPCVDAGAAQSWMLGTVTASDASTPPESASAAGGAVDLDGNARVLHGAVDMGAYELPFVASIRVFLEGAYDGAAHAMRGELAASLPLTAPYAADPRAVSHVPAEAVDWVLVELLPTNGAPAVARSAFVDKDGRIVDPEGGTGLVLEAAAGGVYYVAVKHRNHLAVMSAAPLAFTSRVVNCDFTADAVVAAGGAAALVEVEPGVWAMAAGDADGDGDVLPADAAICAGQVGLTGYRRGDLDLDGSVTANELAALWAANEGRASMVTNPAVWLSPALSVTPRRLTCLAGWTNVLHAAGRTNDVHWTFVHNRSGATLVTQDVERVVYRAGTNASCKDVIEAWEADNRLGRMTVNVLSPDDMNQAGKAIVISGRAGVHDVLWETTDALASYAYTALMYRGFARENVAYLSPEPNRDVDDDGLIDIYADNTHSNVQEVFNVWARGCRRLFVYLVDHGGQDELEGGYYRLDGSDLLTASELDEWLDALQDADGTEITLVVDCCHSGSFLDELTYTGTARRVVAASCDSGQPTYFAAGGAVSFSDAFLSGVLLGYDVGRAFTLAREAMAVYQEAGLDADGDGLYVSGTDEALATNVIGATGVAGLDRPRIGGVRGTQILSGETAATLAAEGVSSPNGAINRVWCVIVPPGHNPDPDDPVSNLTELELTRVAGTAAYKATFDGFAEEGTYKVIYYAADDTGAISAPQPSFVLQSVFDERAVIVAGDVQDATRGEGVHHALALAYTTLRGRALPAESIRVLGAELFDDLDGDGANDVSAFSSLLEFRNAVTNWAAGADRLVVYLVGEGVGQRLRLNRTEWLDSATLDECLDAYQQSNREAIVIMDFAESAALIPELAPPPDEQRIVLASTRTKACAFEQAGYVSFSHYFFSSIFQGNTVWDAYVRAKKTIRCASGRQRQRALLDDDGDGQPSKRDGALARARHIGMAFMTGDDIPLINAVMPPCVATNGPITLWAADVVDMDGISNVWCVVTPPDHDGQSPLPSMNLAWNASAARYEANYDDFEEPGNYIATFYCIDVDGDVSESVQTEIVRPDAYEPDDRPRQASRYGTVAQLHTFHTPDDEDWIRFYAVADFLYELETFHYGTNVDTAVQVYREQPDGQLEFVDGIDEFGGFEGEFLQVDKPSAGFYLIRVSQGDPNGIPPGGRGVLDDGASEWVPGGYELSITVPTGDGDMLVVVAVDRLDPSRAPPGALATLDASSTNAFGTANSVSFAGMRSGEHLVEVIAPAGYVPEEDPDIPGEVTNTVSSYGNPKLVDADELPIVLFSFVPMFRAAGVVRDAFTGERVSGAGLAFRARGGAVSNEQFSAYPNYASYAVPWASASDGAFPSNVWLPTVAWDLTLSRTNYTDTTFAAVITNAQPGDIIDLGDLGVAPIDANSNHIADTWEGRHFPGGCSAGDDGDGDGLSNAGEYRAGTDPTNAADTLQLTGTNGPTPDGFTLTWSVVPGRGYAVEATSTVSTATWPLAAGPWEATGGQSRMRWTDTNAPPAVRFYRIRLALPDGL